MMRSQNHIANARYHHFADPPADLQLDKDAISASFCRNNNLARCARRLRIAARLPLSEMRSVYNFRGAVASQIGVPGRTNEGRIKVINQLHKTGWANINFAIKLEAERFIH